MDPSFDTRKLMVAQYIATILTLIRREYTRNLKDFHSIIENGAVVCELEENWDYYHMYDFRNTVEELKKFEPLIQV